MRKPISKLLALLLLGAISCVPGSSPIRITGTFSAVDDMGACTLDNDIGQTLGRLDASGGGDYLIVLQVESELNAGAQITNHRGLALTGTGKHIFVVDGLFLTYRSTNPVITFEQEVIPISSSFDPETNDNRLGVDIIGDKAATRLRDMLTDPMQVTQLFVNVQLRGHLESGETVQSNTLTYPIEVRTSNAACPEPGNVTRTGPCGVRGGQDGTTFSCCTGPGVPVGCP